MEARRLIVSIPNMKKPDGMFIEPPQSSCSRLTVFYPHHSRVDCYITCLNFLLGPPIAQDQFVRRVGMEWEVWEEDEFTIPTYAKFKGRREKCRDGSEPTNCNKTWPNPKCWCNDVDVAFNFKGKGG